VTGATPALCGVARPKAAVVVETQEQPPSGGGASHHDDRGDGGGVGSDFMEQGNNRSVSALEDIVP
jgi:hypothetical protein